MNEDKSVRYNRLRRRAALASTVLGGALLVLFLVSGWSVLLREWADAASAGLPALTVIVYVALLVALIEVAQLPIAFYSGVILERRYGLSVQPVSRWWADWLKGTTVGLAMAILAALVVSMLIRTYPERWWLFAALCFGSLLVILAQLAPVLLLPLFYTFTPLDRPSLSARLAALAERCGARVLGVFEWRLGDRTRKANAALTGIGRTRRILLSDTMLADYSDDEIEVVVAHELGHHVHHDIWKSIALEMLLLAVGLYAADWALEALAPGLGLAGKADVAALPLLVLAVAAVSLILLPLANGLSRRHERRADRFALERTDKAAAFVSVMRRLAAQNLAEERPAPLVEFFFHSHPSIGARVDHAHAWQAGRGGGGTRADSALHSQGVR